MASHCARQVSIFNADDGADYRTECARSGEPLIQTMTPETDAHPHALDGAPFARTILGEDVRHLSAHEVRCSLPLDHNRDAR